MHERYSGIKGKLKYDSKFKCETCANQQTDITEDCPGIELNGEPFETVENFYLGDTIRVVRHVFDSVIIRITG